MDSTLQQKLLADLQQEIHQNSVQKGFWDEDRNAGEAIALMHSELSEALEALRSGNPKDSKLPEFESAEVELADCIIRILDYAAGKNMRLVDALFAKMAYNKTRAYKHGKSF